MKKLSFLLSLLLVSVTSVKSQVFNVYVSEGQFFKHPNNLSLEQSKKENKLEYTKHATVLGTAVYVFNLNVDSLTVFVEDSTGLREFQSQYHLLTTTVSLNGDLNFQILDYGNGLTGNFKVTKTVLGSTILIYESTEPDATYGFFDPVVDVTAEKKESN